MEVKLSEIPMKSPSLDLKRLPSDIRIDIAKHREELKEKKYKNTFRSCCFEIDRRMLEYLTQTLIGVGIISFCSYMLTISDCSESAPFWGMLGSTVGFFLKSGMDKSKS